MASQQRIALIIGNGAYQNSRPLANPVNDAALITRRFLDLEYEIVGGATSSDNETGLSAGMDLASVQMVGLIGEFISKVKPGATAVIYYAGHGLQVEGRNYLVPVDDTLDRSLPNFGLIEIKPRIETLVSRLGEDGVAVVLLDACRDDSMTKEQRKRLLDLLDPVERAEHGQEQDTSSTRSRGGLSTIKIAPTAGGGRTFVGFATAPGDYAYDGKKGSINSPFARALGDHLAIRGLEIEALYDRVALDVRARVLEEHGKIQDPWSETNLSRSLYLYPRTPLPVFALGAAGAVAGAVVSSLVFSGGSIARPPADWAWFLGGVFGLVGFWGTLQWGSKRLEHAVFAFLGPLFGFAVALAVLMMIPDFPAKLDLDAKVSPARQHASTVFIWATLIGMVVYFIGAILTRISNKEPWPRSFLGRVNRLVTWLLPVLMAITLISLDNLLAFANPYVTAVTLCALLAGILYAVSAELGCRPQLGLFREFGAFTGAVSVGLLMAVLFAAYAWIHFKVYGARLPAETLQTIMVGFGAFWHMLLGAQLGYCFAYYVPDHKRVR